MARNRQGILLVPLAALLASALVASCSNPSTEDRLRSRLDQAADPSPVDFTFRTAGTRVNECFRPNQNFDGAFDRTRGQLILHAPGDPDEVLAVISSTATVLNAQLFRGTDVPSMWVRLPERLVPAATATLQNAVGVDLASYVLDGQLPATAQDTVRAALEATRSVEALGRSRIGSRSADGYRIQVDGDELAEASGDDQDVVPTVVAWFADDDSIVRIEVQVEPNEARSEANADEGLTGWTVDYGPSTARPPAVDTSDVTELAPSAVASLRPAPIATCGLPAS